MTTAPLRLLTASICLASAPWAFANTFVRIDYNLNLQGTAQNTVFIELFDDRPLTGDNFLQYVDAGKYDSSIMHRLAAGFVLQGGGFYESYNFFEPENPEDPDAIRFALDPNVRVDLDGNPATPNPPVNNEFGNTPFRSNLTGTLAMAKVGGNPNSATNQYFFNLANNAANLDNQNGGFTVFAQVVGNGMGLVNAMAGLNRLNLNADALTEAPNGDFISQTPDGQRDFGDFAGPFTSVPALGMISQNFIIATVEKMSRVDYFKAGTTTNLASGKSYTSATPAGFVDNGATISGFGAITISSGGRFGVAPGASINPRVVAASGGRLEVGNLLGAINLRALSVNIGGVLAMQIGGAATGSYDQITLSQDALLNGGQLEVSLISGYAPKAGDVFSLLQSTGGTGISGNFTDFALPELTPGLVWNVQKSTSLLSLSVFAADFNEDGIVDAADYSVWRDTLGSESMLAADADGNGRIEQNDYNIWRQNFGNTRGGNAAFGIPATSVPEPSGAALAIAMASLAFYRWRTWR